MSGRIGMAWPPELLQSLCQYKSGPRTDGSYPYHVVNNTPTVEMVRTQRNCSDNDSFLIEKNSICNRLRSRKYPNWTLQKAYNIAIQKDREHMIAQQKKDSHRQKIFFFYCIQY